MSRIFLLALCSTLWVSCAFRFDPGPDKELPDPLPTLFGVEHESELSEAVGAEILPGNDIRVLNNGVEIFPPMLEAIEGARESIYFSTFVYWKGDVAQRLAHALAERARAGVRTRVLLDWVGTQKMDPELVKMLEEAGATVRYYNPLQWWDPFDTNYRTHRRFLIVDEQIAFTGGAGIATEWEGDARGPGEWRETHYKIRGPIIAQLYGAFAENWNETVPKEEAIPLVISQPPRAGPYRAQAFSSSPADGKDGIYILYHAAIAEAQDSIRIITPFFIIDQATTEALSEAVRRGVEVEILVPGLHMDNQFARKASVASWGPLLEAGIKFYEYQPTMIHTKLMIVDGYWVSIGSANFDNRTFHLNDETNVNVFSEEFARIHNRLFEADLAESKRVTLEAWRERPTSHKLKEILPTLLKSQL